MIMFLVQNKHTKEYLIFPDESSARMQCRNLKTRNIGYALEKHTTTSCLPDIYIVDEWEPSAADRIGSNVTATSYDPKTLLQIAASNLYNGPLVKTTSEKFIVNRVS